MLANTRTCRFALWFCAGALALLLSLSLIGSRWSFWFTSQSPAFHISTHGHTILLARFPDYFPEQIGLESGFTFFDRKPPITPALGGQYHPDTLHPFLAAASIPFPRIRTFSFSIWYPTASAAAVAACLYRLDRLARRRRPHTHCSHCHYDLAGLPLVTLCPECGVPPFANSLPNTLPPD